MTNLYEFQNHAFDYVTIFTYILYIVIALGLSATAPAYLTDLLFYTKMYVSLFLIYRFNPLRFIKFKTGSKIEDFLSKKEIDAATKLIKKHTIDFRDVYSLF